MTIARSVFPFDTSHRADSGIIHGMKKADNIGNDVTIANNFQLLIQRAINGIVHIPNVKNIAIDIFATNVRLFGPTYSKTINFDD